MLQSIVDLSTSKRETAGGLDDEAEALTITLIMKGASESNFFFLDESFASN